MTREEFLNLNVQVTASSVTTNTTTFNNLNIASVVNGSSTLSTNTNNSLFFINGVNIYGSNVISIENNGNDVVVTFDTENIGCNLDSTDKIYTIGKFVQI